MYQQRAMIKIYIEYLSIVVRKCLKIFSASVGLRYVFRLFTFISYDITKDMLRGDAARINFYRMMNEF